METSAIVARYISAWNEPEFARRLQLLEGVWSKNGTYTDPAAHVAGRAALADHIGGFAAQFPGARIELSSAVDAHHGKLRFAWRLLLADGSVYVEGIDFGELAGDGKLLSIVGFFGPLAASA